MAKLKKHGSRQIICFVAMPFGGGTEYDGQQEESDFVLHSIIEAAIETARVTYNKTHPDLSLEITVVRELEEAHSGDITESIIRKIAHSELTIVDLTGLNPNVFLELGVRFSLKRNGTILLTQDTKNIPFNIKTYRTVQYSPLYARPADAVKRLSKTIVRTLEDLDKPQIPSDSLVYQAIPDLSTSTEAARYNAAIISWDEYWEQLQHICNILQDAKVEGVYSPDILLGISNGGLLVADTILRLVYDNVVPLLALWANRSVDNYFENGVNRALISEESLQDISQVKASKNRKIKILVIDDIVGSTKTFRQLIDFMQGTLGKEFFELVEVRFVFVYTPRKKQDPNVSRYLLSEDRSYKVRRWAKLETQTTRDYLPYRKDIRYGQVEEG